MQGISSLINLKGVSQLITPHKTPFLKVFEKNKDHWAKGLGRKLFFSAKQRSKGDMKTT